MEDLHLTLAMSKYLLIFVPCFDTDFMDNFHRFGLDHRGFQWLFYLKTGMDEMSFVKI